MLLCHPAIWIIWMYMQDQGGGGVGAGVVLCHITQGNILWRGFEYAVASIFETDRFYTAILGSLSVINEQAKIWNEFFFKFLSIQVLPF